MREQATINGDGPHGCRAAGQVGGQVAGRLRWAMSGWDEMWHHTMAMVLWGEMPAQAMGSPPTAGESDGRRKARPGDAVSCQTIGLDSVFIIREDLHVLVHTVVCHVHTTSLLSFYNTAATQSSWKKAVDTRTRLIERSCPSPAVVLTVSSRRHVASKFSQRCHRSSRPSQPPSHILPA